MKPSELEKIIIATKDKKKIKTLLLLLSKLVSLEKKIF